MNDRRGRFEAQVLPHLDAAYRFARWLCRSRGDAEDVVQEAMLRAFRGFDSLRGSDARTWLLVIVRNCHATTAAPTLEKPQAAIEVAVKGYLFDPAGITVRAGSTVTWVNLDEEPHTVVSDTGSFRSAVLDTRESFSFTFDKAGTYHYRCTLHPQMTGTIVVE